MPSISAQLFPIPDQSLAAAALWSEHRLVTFQQFVTHDYPWGSLLLWEVDISPYLFLSLSSFLSLSLPLSLSLSLSLSLFLSLSFPLSLSVSLSLSLSLTHHSFFVFALFPSLVLSLI